jgi:hypothetical protein
MDPHKKDAFSLNVFWPVAFEEADNKDSIMTVHSIVLEQIYKGARTTGQDVDAPHIWSGYPK